MIAVLPLAGCGGWQSAIDPKGPAANEIARLIWFFTAVCTVVWVFVMISLLVALMRRTGSAEVPRIVDVGKERRKSRVVSAAVAVTALVLVGLTLLSFFANRTLA